MYAGWFRPSGRYDWQVAGVARVNTAIWLVNGWRNLSRAILDFPKYLAIPAINGVKSLCAPSTILLNLRRKKHQNEVLYYTTGYLIIDLSVRAAGLNFLIYIPSINFVEKRKISTGMVDGTRTSYLVDALYWLYPGYHEFYKKLYKWLFTRSLKRRAWVIFFHSRC